jgi:organic radical activating enzyme
LKVVVPQPLDFDYLSALDFEHRFVQPMDGPSRLENTQLAIEWCLRNPQWRLSVQTHKVIGIR